VGGMMMRLIKVKIDNGADRADMTKILAASGRAVWVKRVTSGIYSHYYVCFFVGADEIDEVKYEDTHNYFLEYD
jgi:hypothetical protein